MPITIQSIPSVIGPGHCCLCDRPRTCCADVFLRRPRKHLAVVCSQCRLANEGEWVPVKPMQESAPLPKDAPRARRLGRGLWVRSPSKHSMPFTF